jgi:hypothetical protein
MDRVSAWRRKDQPCKVCGAAVLARTLYTDTGQTSWPARTDTEMRCSDQDCFDLYDSWIDNGLGQ